MAYTYNDEVMDFKLITTVDLDKMYRYSIDVSGSQYIFNVNGTTTTMSRGCDFEKANGFLLFAYFGGDEVAPHDITIDIIQ